MKKAFTLIAFLITLLTVFTKNTHASGSSNILRCDNCNSFQMENIALASGKNGVVDVIDLRNFSTRSYLIFNEPGFHVVQPVGENQDVKSLLAEMKELKSTVKERLSQALEVDISDLEPYLDDKNSLNVLKVMRFKTRTADVAGALGDYIFWGVNRTSIAHQLGIFGISFGDFIVDAGYSIKVTFGSSDQYIMFEFKSLSISPSGITFKFVMYDDTGHENGVRIASSGNGNFTMTGSPLVIQNMLINYGYTLNTGSSSITDLPDTITTGCNVSKNCTVQD